MSRLTLVCFAVPQEAAPFRRLCPSSGRIRLVVTGMGATNAERALMASLREMSPQRVFTCGFAGALNPAFRIGDVLFDAAQTPQKLKAQLENLGCQPGTFHCATQVAVTRSQKGALREQTGADVVEMESGAIQRRCAALGIECCTLRAVSDVAEEDLPLDFNRLFSAEQSLSPLRLSLAILSSPHKIPALIKLGQNSTRAAEALARVLSQIV